MLTDGGNISRRRLLVWGGAGVGLLVAWAAWPRHYAPNLIAAKGETIYGPYLKIGEDGHVAVAVPQAEMGQGVWTSLPQILADELGADWRTVAVEPAPINPLYANRLFVDELAADLAPSLERFADQFATRSAFMATAGSTSIRQFEAPMREAGAAARVRLCMAAAKRWGVDWETCDTEAGFVTGAGKKLRFGELAAEAAGFDAPDPPPLRMQGAGKIAGRPVPRLDIPSKIDGSAAFAADVRLPNMIFAAIRQGPIGETKLLRTNKAAADRVPGVLQVIENGSWVAAVASNWWAADHALDALAPRFETTGTIVSDAGIAAALDKALTGDGDRIAHRGDLAAAFKGAQVYAADYRVEAAAHAAIEPVAATAAWDKNVLELWLPTQAPETARTAAAAALKIGADQVIVHPMIVGGGFGRGLDAEAAVQAAIIAQRVKKPVQLMWSRAEDIIRDRFRPPARARLTARLGAGRIDALLTKIAAPAYGNEVASRLLANERAARALVVHGADAFAVAGAEPVYTISNFALDHHPAKTGLPAGYWRSAAHSYSCFFTESFVDEMAAVAGVEPFSFRMAMLGGAPRLARCLSTAATLGGWQGGAAGTGQGIAIHASRGSSIAVLAEAHVEGGAVKVDRLVAVADVGRVIHPDIVRQQIEGGLIFGLAMAVGSAPGFERGLTKARRLADLNLPVLANSPEIDVELIPSSADPGGVSELAVPPVAPAIANALFAATGRRYRSLPIRLGGVG